MNEKIIQHGVEYVLSLLIIDRMKNDCKGFSDENILKLIDDLWGALSKKITKKFLKDGKKYINQIIVDEQGASKEEMLINFLAYSLDELIFQLLDADGFTGDGVIDYRVQEVDFVEQEHIFKSSKNVSLNSYQEEDVRKKGDEEIEYIKSLKESLGRLELDQLSDRNYIFRSL